MTKRNLQVASVALAVLGISGCGNMWKDFFGGSSRQAATLAPGGMEVCNPPRDPNLATWLTTNQPCSSTDQCHVGSFCTGSGSAGVCIRECGDGLPACSGNRYCSCQGLCEAITASPGGDASVPSPSCDKVVSRLDEIKNSNDSTKWVRCESDDICPNGAFCNQSIGYCDWECLDDLGCDTGMTCNCLGRCENPDAGTTVVRRKFAMDVSPAVLLVTPAVTSTGDTVNTWVRTMNIVLSTRDETLLGGTGDTRSFLATVTVRPGASLKVACNASGTPNYQTQGCDVGTTDGDSWQFSLVGEVWTATKTVWLTPSGAAGSGDAGAAGSADAGTVGDDWTIRIHSDATAPGTQVVPVQVGAAMSASNWTAPVWSDFGFTGGGDAPKGFRGIVLLKTPLGFAGESLPGVDHEIQVPVRASVRPENGDVVYLTIADPTTLFLQGSTLTLASFNAFPSQGPWLALENAGRQAAQGRWDIEYNLTEFKRNQRTGTLVGKFEGQTTSDSIIFQQIAGSFTLEVDSSFVPCTDDSSCTGGATCGEGGLCVNAVPAPAVSDTLGLTLEHETRKVGDATYAAQWTVKPEFIFGNLYRVWGGGADDLGGLVIGGESVFQNEYCASGHATPAILAASQIERKAVSEAIYDDYNLHAFAHVFTGLESIQYGVLLTKDATGEQCTDTDTGRYDCLKAMYTSTGVKNIIGCVDELDTSGGTGKYNLAEMADARWAASCQKLWSNIRTVVPERSDVADFRDACVYGSDSLTVNLRDDVINPAGESHWIYFCPDWIEPILWGAGQTSSRGVDAAYRYMCFDAATDPAQHSSLVGRTLDPAAILPYAGEYQCIARPPLQAQYGNPNDDIFPSGIDLLDAQDRFNINKLSKTPAELLRSCLDDLSSPAETWPLAFPDTDQTGLDKTLARVYPKKDCFSTMHFFSALAQARESVEGDKATYGDVAAQRLYLRLLQQWMEMHSFIATEGLEEYRLATEEKGRAALPSDSTSGSAATETAARDAVALTDLLTTLESGFALVLDQAGIEGVDLGVSPWVVRQPDYRDLPLSMTQGQNDQQPFGLPPQLLETATAYLRLLEEYLDAASMDAYAQVVDGTVPHSLIEARRQVGLGIRMTATIEAVAAKLVDLAAMIKQDCTAATEKTDCHGATKCSTQDGSVGYCLDSPWYDHWDNARKSYLRVRRELVNKALGDANPLGISENDLPLFFGDLTGTNSRFFAASDYLINTWAVAAVSSAQGALDKARDAWIARRNAGFQDVMNQQEQDRRLQAIKEKYGQVIVDNCGLPSDTTAELALSWAAKTQGSFADKMNECFIDRERKNSEGRLMCRGEDPLTATAPTQKEIDDCVDQKVIEANTSYLDDIGYYNSGFHSYNGCTPACRNYFRARPDDKGVVKNVRVRKRGAPAPGMRMWGYAQWGEKRLVGGIPRNVSIENGRNLDLWACNYFYREMEQVKCLVVTESGNELVRCYPRYTYLPDGRWVNDLSGCSCSGGELTKGCKNHTGEDCSGRDVQFPVQDSRLKYCYTGADGSVLVEKTDDGTWSYRPCSQTECAPDQTPDLCGLPALGYSSGIYWETGGGSTTCWGDAYSEQDCDRDRCDQGAKDALSSQRFPQDVMDGFRAECEDSVGASKQQLTVIPNPPECYRGLLGTAVLKMYGALQDVELARLAWTSAQNSYDIQGTTCAKLEDIDKTVKTRQAAFLSQMQGWRAAKAKADEIADAARHAAGLFDFNPLSAVSKLLNAASAPFEIESIELDKKMADAQQGFDAFMRNMNAQEQIIMCYSEANKLKAQFDVEKGQIVRRATDLGAARTEFARVLGETERAYNEGQADLKTETGRTAPSFAHSYWYDEKADRYLREFTWAQRLVYLAMRAVEYEFQESLGLRKDILTATHPDQLESAIRAMQTEVATRAINRRRPEPAATVLSLRDDILGIVDMSVAPKAGERNFAPVQTFRARLWDDKYALYDKMGKWVGQGVPFALTPQGALVDRCAERLWQVTATIQGDGLSDTQPGASIKLLKRNTFSSQWCEGRGDGSAAQIGHLEPSNNLFRQDPGAQVSGESDAYSTAAIYPWFNVRRADFYKSSYQEGASEELAGRGLYGDYVLLFPAELLEGKEVPTPPDGQLGAGFRIDQFPLDRVEDVLLRFDYISVDNFAARGVQVQP